MRKRKNNGGFTVIEVLISFVLVMILLINMFTIIMSYRNRAQLEMLRADYLTFKSTVTKDIQTDILRKGLESMEPVTPASSCGSDITQCIRLNFSDGTSKNLFIYNKQTKEAVRNKYLQYGEQKYKIRDDIPEDSQIPNGKTALDYQTVDIYQGRLLEILPVGDDTIYGIHITMKYSDFADDFGIHIVAIPGYKDKGGSTGPVVTPSPVPTTPPAVTPTPTPTPVPTYSLAEKVSTGDYVAYDAGTWPNTVSISSTATTFTFGGYQAGTSRNDSISCWNGNANQHSGWRVLSITNSAVSLVHAGTPECMLFPYVDNNSGIASNAQVILSGIQSYPSWANSNFTNSPRDWSYYVNTTYASSATSLTKEMLNDTLGITMTNNETYTNDFIMTGSYYWLSTAPMYSNDFWSVTPAGTFKAATGIYGKSPIFGVRPVVTLKASVKTTGKNESGAWTLTI